MPALQRNPHITALRTYVAPTRPRPEWADKELPSDVGAMLDVATHLPRLGGWELAPRDHAESSKLVPAATRKRHTRWLLLADNGMTWLLAGWSKSDSKATAYIVDHEEGGVSKAGALEAYVELMILDDPVTLERSPEIVAAVEAALAAEKLAATRASASVSWRRSTPTGQQPSSSRRLKWLNRSRPRGTCAGSGIARAACS